MSKNDSTQTPAQEPSAPASPTFRLEDFGQVIGDAVAKGIAANTRRKITPGEYAARGGNSPFHPDPKKRVKMNREYYSNGRLIELSTAFDREVELLNEITHSGRYIDRLVEVVVQQNGADEAVNIVFSNKSQFAFELKGKAKDFTAILEQIVAAQKIEREEMEDDKAERAERRRAFGSGKNTRAAQERAGA